MELQKVKKSTVDRLIEGQNSSKHNADRPHLIPLGLYRHYKGKDYEVLGVARHSESHEMLVVYKALYDSPEFGENTVWTRPLDMFLETIEINGEVVPRFSHIGNK